MMRAAFLALFSSLSLFALATSVTGCASSDLVRAAKEGDQKRFAEAVTVHDKSGDLSNGEALNAAYAIIEHEFSKAKRVDLPPRVDALYSCAKSTKSILDHVADDHDEAGGRAALLLVQTGTMSASSFDTRIDDPIEGFRAIAARKADDDGERSTKKRHQALADGSPIVRRAAIQAANDAKDPSDLPLLRDRARLDPSPMVRSEAVRALLHHRSESTESILRLLADADDVTRSELATALATTRYDPENGAPELRRLLAANGTRASAMLGAVFFVRGNHPDDPQTSELATSIVMENLRRGGRVERMATLRLVPLRSPFLEEVETIARASDREGMLAAWTRLLEIPAREKAATDMLMRFAGNDYGRLSSEARKTLASRHVTSIQAWIERDLASPDEASRRLAISALGDLDRVSRATRLLSSKDADFRIRSACAMLATQDR